MRIHALVAALFATATIGCTPIDAINNFERPWLDDSDVDAFEPSDSGSVADSERVSEPAQQPVRHELVVVVDTGSAAVAQPVASTTPTVRRRTQVTAVTLPACGDELPELDAWCARALDYELACRSQLVQVHGYCGRVDDRYAVCEARYGKQATACSSYVRQQNDCRIQHWDVMSQLDDAQAQIVTACEGATKLRARCSAR
jgi:hypothetical protein